MNLYAYNFREICYTADQIEEKIDTVRFISFTFNFDPRNTLDSITIPLDKARKPLLMVSLDKGIKSFTSLHRYSINRSTCLSNDLT